MAVALLMVEGMIACYQYALVAYKVVSGLTTCVVVKFYLKTMLSSSCLCCRM
jgi:hypothetical protein